MSQGRILKHSIKQVVPAGWCFNCDVCCRFPDKDSFLAPYFTEDEIIAAITTLGDEGIQPFKITGQNPPLPPFNKGAGLPLLRSIATGRGGFKTGCKITLSPYKEGYICPAFDPKTAHCKIYDARPVDCMLYPFAVMRDITGKEVVLGVDRKCPYIRGYMEAGSIMDASREIASAVESPPLLDIFAENRSLIGPFQDDVFPLMTLKKLTSIV